MLWNAKNGSVPIGSTEMSYVSFGNGEKAFILLPGLSDGLTTVKGKAAMLARPYRLFFEKYTVYMFSRKDDMPEDYSIRDMADDQAEAMKALGIRRASVMGVSQGGMIAQCLAIWHPELVEKLVIAVSAPCANDPARSCVSRWMEYARQDEHKQLMISTAENSYSPARLARIRRAYPIIGLVGKPSDYRRFLINAEAILRFDARDELGKIACPTLIIGGEEDKIVGAEASRELNRRIPGSRIWLYEGLGHAAYEEAPDFNQRVFNFLEAPA